MLKSNVIENDLFYCTLSKFSLIVNHKVIAIYSRSRLDKVRRKYILKKPVR